MVDIQPWPTSDLPEYSVLGSLSVGGSENIASHTAIANGHDPLHGLNQFYCRLTQNDLN